MNQQLQDEQLIDLRELLRALNRFKWGIVSVAVVVTVIAVMIVFSMSPIYRATTTILIESKNNRPIKEVEEIYDPGMGRTEYFATQYEILKSREMAQRVVEKLDLPNRPEFAALESTSSDRLNWRKWLPFLPEGAEKKPLSESERKTLHKESVVTEFGKRLNVAPIFYTQLVNVSFDAKDPELATLVANTLADTYIESALEGRLSMAQKANSWLTEKLASLRGELQKADQAMQAFREQEALVNVGGERGLVEIELTDNASRLREARKLRTDLASAYWKIKQAGNDTAKLEDVSTLLQSDLVLKAKEGVFEATKSVKQLESRYGPKHPEMISARARLDEANDTYRRQLYTAAKGVQAQYEIAQNTENELSQFEQRSRGTIRGLDRKEYQLKALERDVETNRQLYDMFLTRFKETDITGTYEDLSARIVDHATIPRIPYAPKKGKIVFLAMIGGIFLGLLLAGLSALLSDMIRSNEELESVTGLAVLGVIPMVGSLGSSKRISMQFVDEPRSGFSEGIRGVRTGVVLSDLDHKKKRLVVTSSVPEEGKTTLAMNLALAHGQIEKVLLLDGDLRRPNIAKQCGLSRELPGLCETLSGTTKLTDCIYRFEAGNIDVMPVGKIPPNPAEILTSERFHQLLDVLNTKYDRIIVDSAPCHAVSDTFLLARHTDAMIFLVKADSTGRRMVKRAIHNLRNAQVSLLGTVINQVDMKRHGHDYGSYYYDYGYYDGEKTA